MASLTWKFVLVAVVCVALPRYGKCEKDDEVPVVLGAPCDTQNGSETAPMCVADDVSKKEDQDATSLLQVKKEVEIGRERERGSGQPNEAKGEEEEKEADSPYGENRADIVNLQLASEMAENGSTDDLRVQGDPIPQAVAEAAFPDPADALYKGGSFYSQTFTTDSQCDAIFRGSAKQGCVIKGKPYIFLFTYKEADRGADNAFTDICNDLTNLALSRKRGLTMPHVYTTKVDSRPQLSTVLKTEAGECTVEGEDHVKEMVMFQEKGYWTHGFFEDAVPDCGMVIKPAHEDGDKTEGQQQFLALPDDALEVAVHVMEGIYHMMVKYGPIDDFQFLLSKSKDPYVFVIDVKQWDETVPQHWMTSIPEFIARVIKKCRAAGVRKCPEYPKDLPGGVVDCEKCPVTTMDCNKDCQAAGSHPKLACKSRCNCQAAGQACKIED